MISQRPSPNGLTIRELERQACEACERKQLVLKRLRADPESRLLGLGGWLVDELQRVESRIADLYAELRRARIAAKEPEFTRLRLKQTKQAPANPPPKRQGSIWRNSKFYSPGQQRGFQRAS